MIREIIIAKSLGEFMLNAKKSGAKVCVPDEESAQIIADNLGKEITESLDALCHQQRKQIEDSRLKFTQMNTPFDI